MSRMFVEGGDAGREIDGWSLGDEPPRPGLMVRLLQSLRHRRTRGKNIEQGVWRANPHPNDKRAGLHALSSRHSKTPVGIARPG